jgi:hypothetical protein
MINPGLLVYAAKNAETEGKVDFGFDDDDADDDEEEEEKGLDVDVDVVVLGLVVFLEFALLPLLVLVMFEFFDDKFVIVDDGICMVGGTTDRNCGLDGTRFDSSFIFFNLDDDFNNGRSDFFVVICLNIADEVCVAVLATGFMSAFFWDILEIDEEDDADLVTRDRTGFGAVKDEVISFLLCPERLLTVALVTFVTALMAGW